MPRDRQRVPPLVSGLLGTLVLLAVGLALARPLGRHARAVDLIAQAGPILAPAFVAAALVLLLAGRRHRRRRGVRAVLVVFVIAAAGWSAAPTWRATLTGWIRGSESAGSGPERRIVVANVQGRREALDRLAPHLVAESIDLVVLVEADASELRHLVTNHPTLDAALPFRSAPRPGLRWPIVLMARHPLHELRFEADEATRDRYRHLFAWRRSVAVDWPEIGRVVVAAVHAPSPRTNSAWAAGLETVELLAEVARDHLAATGWPVLIAGDFNTGLEGVRHRVMAERSGLRPASATGGATGTWPARFPAWLRLPLDEVWLSPSLEVRRREVWPDVGSDHRPLLVVVGGSTADGAVGADADPGHAGGG